MIPGSAMRRLAAITGLEVRKEAEACFALIVSSGVSLFSMKSDEKEACKELREFNFRRVSHLVFEKQGWKCAECGRVLPLSAHHIRFRSRWRRSDGPLDVESNLSGLCAQDHESEHR